MRARDALRVAQVVRTGMRRPEVPVTRERTIAGVMRLLAVFLLALAPQLAFADAKAGAKKAQLCTLCHRTGSQFGTGIPVLEAQPAKYLVAATNQFKAGLRSSPAMQPNIERLTPRDIADIADYFASLPPVAQPAVDAAKAAAGAATLRALQCATCHREDYAGADIVPRLAGQGAGYVAAQLEAFANARRPHPPTEMPAAADVEGVAAFLSTLK